MSERLIQIDGIELCAESFGQPADPAVLLVMGAQSSMVWWEEDFCRRLAEAGRFVIRYDNRDTGRSTVYEPGQPGYTFIDMADDAIRVLDAYGIGQAHFVGISMGGMLTQMAALRHPGRVRSVTLLSSSNFAPDLPPMEQKVVDYFSNAGEIDWTDKEAVLAFNVGKWDVLAGSKNPFDDNIRRLAELEWDRARNPASMNNHGLVTGGFEYLSRTAEIAAPALVIHGTEDPIIPYEHGVRLAEAIPGAELLTLEGVGHELHPNDWDAILGAIVRRTSGNRPA